MKKCILSVLEGAATMFLLLVLIANKHSTNLTEEYGHIDFVLLSLPLIVLYAVNRDCTGGEDNVGIVDLNTFELLYLPINSYGELIEEPAGVMLSNSLMNQDTETYVRADFFRTMPLLQ